MKKVLLTLTMLLLAFTGTMKAESLTVHDGTTTNGFVPVYGFYADAYNKCEMVYPAAELSAMAGGTINSLTFYAQQTSVNWGANFQVFVAEVADATISAFAGPGTVVYEGQLSIADGEMVVTFDTPYAYAGGNLLVGVYETSTGSYITSNWYGESVTGASGSGYNYSDLASCNFVQRNFLPKTTFDYTVGGGGAQTAFSTIPEVLDLGYRPNGAWMAPYVFNLKSNVGAVTVNALDFSGNYFTYNAELPATVSGNNPLEVAVSTGTADEGEVNSTITILYSGNNRDSEQLEITAYAYNPVEGDVFEQAIEVPMVLQQEVTKQLPIGTHFNYDIPNNEQAADAVYKVTFDQEVILYAGGDGNIAVYAEDFDGEGGPMVDNTYQYTGPQINPGPTNLWFNYDYTGSNTWYGTSAGGGFYFGYKISTDVIAAENLAGLTITTVEAAAREAYPYHCFIIEGGVDPFDGNMIGGGTIENPTAQYFFDINLNIPAYISGDSDIWVIFYSDSPYAAYCGRYPVDTPNGKIWTCNPNATTPQWTSNTNYTPVIYCHMLELPTGRTATMDLAKMEVKKGNGVVSEVAEAEGNVMNVAKANMRNRDTQTLFEQGFEDGMGEWTMNNCHSSSGPSSSYTAHGGSSVFRFYYTTNYPQYLISPVLEDNNGGNMSFYYASYSSSYAETFKVGYSTTTNDPSAFTWGSQVTATNLYSSNYLQYSYDFPAGTKYVAIACTSNDQFYLFVDDIVVTADITSGGGGTPEPPTPSIPDPIEPTFEVQYESLMEAGTYYVVATDSILNMVIDYVPLPEQALVVSPYDGETNVEYPYLAEWIIGDYTTEMQVLLGTQYPPQTALIDWTDYLVESAFLPELEPNQSYFFQVNERNTSGTTYGEIIAFTTPIDPVEGFAVVNDSLYPGDAAVFTWEANRSFKGYNLYMDGVKVNETPITENTYSVEDLEYNMEGYNFQVTAVYDAGESMMSEPINVKMTGTGFISGHVYDAPNGYDPEDPDQSHPVANLPVFILVQDEYGQMQEYEAITNEEGLYTAEVLAGIAIPGISLATAQAYGYGPAAYSEAFVMVAYEDEIEGIDIYTHEYYYPVGMVTATEEEDDVLVEWSWNPADMIVDFETGDFSQADFTLPASYPWAITTTNPHEGTYAMKSTCEGIASGTSSIEVTVEVPYDAKMGFWVRVSSESNYDKFHFYIDGVEQGQALSGNLAYQYKEFAVTEGTHTYKWEYTKDSSVNSNDDCVYVDDVTMYRMDIPEPPIQGATTYDFDDDTMMGWTSLDANNDGYGWVSSADPGLYHNAGVSLSGTGHNDSEGYVISGSYSNATGQAITPDNYLVSPTQITAEDGAQIRFWACAQDASYAAEHFGVAVSTGTATAANFTTIQEWTMTAKGTQGTTAESENNARGTRQGSWYEYTVDLSSYAGQDIWVAIRHFNCNDQFILNVDDITLADGSGDAMTRDLRTFQSFNVYRRNLLDTINNPTYEPELLAEGTTEFSYTDTDELEFGVWQWGIQATYEGYAPIPERSRETATFGFEGGLEGWTGIVVNTDGGQWLHSDDNLGGYDYSELAHTGTGFAMCYSFVDYQGSYNTDAYLVSPQKYSVDANSSISFWADNANDSYPENFSVCVSTAANPTASDFVQIWNGGAKGANVEKAAVRHSDNRYENWRSHEISLADYAGQEIWIAFHDVNYDMYEIWIDDVTINYAGGAPVPPTPGPTGSGLSEIIWSNEIEIDMEALVTFIVAVNNGQSADGAEVTIEGVENSYEATIVDGTAEVVVRKGDTYNVTVALEGYTSFTDEWYADESIKVYDIMLNEIIAPVADLYVSPTGFVVWEGMGEGGDTPVGPTGSTSFTEDFEGGLNGWTGMVVNADGGEWLHSDDNLGGYDYTELAHGGTGFAMCYSYVDYVGAYNTDAYLVTPQKYDIVAGSTLQFFADNANDSYPENFSVCVATVDNPTAADFTQVWAGGAKGQGGNDVVRHINNRYQNWREHSIDLSAYAGQSVWIAFHDVNYDSYEIWIDDVQLSVVNKGERAPISYKVKLDGVYVGETYIPYFQHDVELMEEGETHITEVAPLYASGMGEWVSYEWTYTPCDEFNFAGATNVIATENEPGTAVEISWTMPNGGVNPGPNPGNATTFEEGFENGMPADWTVVDANNDGWTWCLTSAIPTTWTYYASLTLDWYRTGSNAICSGSYINGVGALNPDEYLVMGQVNLVSGSTLSFWGAATDASYPADHFGVFVSDDGNAWTLVQEWTMTGKSNGNGGRASRDGNGAKLGSWHNFEVDLSAYAGQKYLAIRHFNCTDQYIMVIDDIELGVANKGRDMWDFVASFQGTSAGQQAVATDGEFIYTASWQTTPTGGHTFYKYDLDGTFIEGFEIAGATGIRDLTTDGEYFYGTSGGTQIFCMDFTNKTLVSTINCSGLTSRHISYDPERDGFWSGNWSTLALYSRTGALIQNGPAPTSAYGSAYYKDQDGVEHLFLFCQPNSDCKVYDYNITTGTLGTNVVLDFSTTTPGCTGIAGGCFIGNYDDKLCWFGNSQQDPNLIGIYELEAGAAPVPVNPEGVLGSALFRDGELIAVFMGEEAATNSYVDYGMEIGEHEYCVRVIYGGEPDVDLYVTTCPVCADVNYTGMDEIDVVNNIYPNPTRDMVTIEAEAMNHITVVNSLGQVVYDADVNADMLQLNLGQYKAGLYMVRISTENGVSVKRVTVVK